MALSKLGFDTSFQQSFAALRLPSSVVPARVVRGGSASVSVASDDDAHPPVAAAVRGEAPVVGDWIAHDRERGLVVATLPRRTSFVRKSAGRSSRPQIIAANADVAFVVMALLGDDSTRRLERYLALVHAAGAEPIVLLTKASLHPAPEARAAEIAAIAAPHRVLLLDLPANRGGPALRSCLSPGRTAVLLGSSGAGKSTIVNHLADEAIARIGEIRENDARGKHTTTHRELFVLPSGALLIDTPGMREIGLVSTETDVDAVFEDVTRLAEACRFRDCRHAGEPGCAVLAANVSGALDEGRLGSFRQLQAEAAHEARRRDDHARRKEGRAGAKLIREALERKGRR